MIYAFLCDGYEATEAVSSVGILRRAKIETLFVGVDSKIVKDMFGLQIQTDISLDEVDKSKIEGIVLPGGMPGVSNLESNSVVCDIIKFCYEKKFLIAAICAAPSILGKMGILKGKVACCYPGFEKYLEGASISYDNVCVSENIITSRGPGTAVEFGLEIVSFLKGKKISEMIEKGIQFKRSV